MAAVAALLFALLVSVRAQCQNGTVFTTPKGYIDNINACAFPTTKLNQTCVSANCPSLSTSGLCPFNSDNTVNQTSAQATVTLINRCIGQLTTLCGISWDPIQGPAMGLSQSFGIFSGQCSLLPNTGIVTGLSNTTVSFKSSSTGVNPLSVSITAPGVLFAGSFQCGVSVSLGFGIPRVSLNAPNTPASIKTGFTATATISTNNSTPTVTSASMTPVLDLGQVFKVDTYGFQTALTAFVNLLVSQSDEANVFATFVFTYVALALQVVNVNCPKS